MKQTIIINFKHPYKDYTERPIRRRCRLCGFLTIDAEINEDGICVDCQ